MTYVPPGKKSATWPPKKGKTDSEKVELGPTGITGPQGPIGETGITQLHSMVGELEHPEPRDEMPAEYDAGKVFDILHDVALNLAMDVVKASFKSEEEYLLRRISDTMAEMLTEERETVRKFKRETEEWSKHVAENMAQMSVQLFDLTKDLTQAREEVVRLKTENRSLRVSGTLKKSPRKISGLKPVDS